MTINIFSFHHCKYVLSFAMFAIFWADSVVAHEQESKELEIETLVEFDVSIGEQPQGLTILLNGNLAVSFPFLGELRIYAPGSGILLTTIANLPPIFGLTTATNGDVLAGAISSIFDPENTNQQGIWRIPTNGESASMLAAFPPEQLPFHMAVLANNSLLVSDIISGTIVHVDSAGNISPWSNDELLMGSGERTDPIGRPPFPVGIEGIHLKRGYLYGVVADHGRYIRYPINTDNNAGEIELLIEKPDMLYGIAQFAFVGKKSIIAVSGFQSEVYRIKKSKKIELLANKDDGIDTPSAIVRGVGEFADTVFISNFAFVTNNAGGNARPSIMKISGFNE